MNLSKFYSQDCYVGNPEYTNQVMSVPSNIQKEIIHQQLLLHGIKEEILLFWYICLEADCELPEHKEKYLLQS